MRAAVEVWRLGNLVVTAIEREADEYELLLEDEGCTPAVQVKVSTPAEGTTFVL